MADNTTIKDATDVTVPIATDDVSGVQFQRVKLDVGGDGATVPVVGALPVTLATLPAISGTVSVSNFPATQPVSIAASVPVTGPLTDTQLRATALPVSGTFFQATQPVSAAALPLPTGASSETTLAALNGKVTAVNTGAVVVSSSALPSGAATETTLAAASAKLPATLGQGTMAQSLTVAIASNQSALPILEAATVLTGQAAQTATVNNILPATAGANGTDVSNFRAMTVQVVSTATGGTFIFEQSLDATNWRPLPVFNSELTTGVPITAAITATVSQIIYVVPLRGTQVRLRIATTITGGSIQAFSRISPDPFTPSVAAIAQPTAASLNATVSGTVTANIGTGALAAGTNAIGDVGLQVRANATGALTVNKVLTAASTNATLIKATAGRVCGWHLTNTSAAIRVVRFHNLTVAPTVGTSVPAYVVAIPAGQSVQFQSPIGIAHSTGISYSITAAIADLDTTVTAANDVVGAIYTA